MTLKTGTGGGERKRARVGEGYGGLRGFEKGEKRENKRREEEDSQQRHDDLFRNGSFPSLKSYRNFPTVFNLHFDQFDCTLSSLKCYSL